MKIEIKKNYKQFWGIVKLIKDVNYESTINFYKDRVFINILDQSKVMLVNITINKKFFDVYDVKKDISFDVDFEIVGRIINSMKKGFSMEEREDELVFRTPGVRRAVKKYVVEKKEREDLPTNHNYYCEVNVDNFLKELGIILEVGQIMRITCDKTSFNMFSKRSMETVDIESKVVKYIKGDKKVIWLGSGYIGKLKNLQSIFSDVKFGIDDEHPFYIEGKTDNVEIKCWIAPRIEGDEND